MPALSNADPYDPIADLGEVTAIRSASVAMPSLRDDEIVAIIAFLGSLTGASAKSSPVPETVPSGLPVDH
jgi:hypothetical protein